MASSQEIKELSANRQATVSIALNGDGKVPVQVFGRITGSFEKGPEFELFYHPSGQHIPVNPGQNIPLDMSKVNAPEHTNEFTVHARLFSYNPPSSNFEIANGNAYFKVGQPGEKVIPGEKGSVGVNVVWA